MIRIFIHKIRYNLMQPQHRVYSIKYEYSFPFIYIYIYIHTYIYIYTYIYTSLPSQLKASLCVWWIPITAPSRLNAWSDFSTSQTIRYNLMFMIHSQATNQQQIIWLGNQRFWWWLVAYSVPSYDLHHHHFIITNTANKSIKKKNIRI